MRRIKLEKLSEVFAALSSKGSLYMPVDKKDGAEYEKWSEGKTLSNALNTLRGPKDFFFPQTEDLMKFRLQGKNIEIVDIRKEDEDFFLFGVRACDVRSFDILDRVFLAEPVDTYYKNRREHCTVFSLACARPSETCFCGTFSISAARPEGDVRCVKTDGYMYFDSLTEKGSAAMALISSVTEESDGAEAEKEQAEIENKLKKLPLASLSADAFGAGKTEEFFSAPEWKELSESCLGCGSCTFHCPTCQCYDIKDFDTGHGVVRFRCWDSCMYSDFTKMSAGQPRLTQMERFRQRFMHKLVYYPTNNDGLFSCVGCGRCIGACPIHTNIVKVMKKLGGKSHE